MKRIWMYLMFFFACLGPVPSAWAGRSSCQPEVLRASAIRRARLH